MPKMKNLFRKSKKSMSEVGSLASGKSASGYEVEATKNLNKFHKAAYEGDLTKLKSLIKKGNINQLDKENRTPLHMACANGKVDAVRLLASDPQCNLNLCDNDRRSALMKCVQCQFQQCLDILLRKGADVSLSDTNGNTALHLACSIPSKDLYFLLADYHANVHAKNKDGATPLHLACSVNEADEMISNLIDDGTDINAVDNSGKTALMVAASRGILNTVKLLLTNNADASVRDNKGWTADDAASMSGHHPISHIIVEHSLKKNTSRPGSKHEKSGSQNHVYDDPAPSNPLSLKSSPAQVKPSNRGLMFDNSDEESDSKHTTLSASEEDEDDPYQTILPLSSTPGLGMRTSTQKNNATKTNGEASNKFQDRLYQSNSRKGGIVSPTKPPLPTSNTGKSPPSRKPLDDSSDDNSEKEEEDSPWDTDDGSEAEKQTTTKSPSINKPDPSILNNLGFSPEEVKKLYGNNETFDTSTDSTHSNKQPQPVNDDVYATVNKKKKMSESEEHSSWNDSSVSEQNVPNYFGTDIKLEDETDEEDFAEKALSPKKANLEVKTPAQASTPPQKGTSSTLEKPQESSRKVGAEARVAVKKASTSSWDSDESLSEEGISMHSSDDSESEGSWLEENRKRHGKASPLNQSNTQQATDDWLSRDSQTDNKASVDVSDGDNHKNILKQNNERLIFKALAVKAKETVKLREKQQKENEEKLKQEQLQKQKEESQRILQEEKLKQEQLQKQKQEKEKQRLLQEEKLKQEQLQKQKEEKEKQRLLQKEKLKQEQLQKQKEEKEKQRLIQEERLKQEQLKKLRKQEEDLRLKQEKLEKEQKEKLEMDRQQQKLQIQKEQEQLQELQKQQLKLRTTNSFDNENLKLAFIDQLDGEHSESEFSDLDSLHMGNAETMPPNEKELLKGVIGLHSHNSLIPISKKRRGLDLDEFTTGSETETEEEIVIGDIPASLKSSQLSESLLRSGERGELEREAAKEKRRAMDALERLEFAKRENQKLGEEILRRKVDYSELEKQREQQESLVRQLNFDLQRRKEQMDSNQLELSISHDRLERLQDQLELEGKMRYEKEVMIRELETDLRNAEQNLKKMEENREEMIHDIKNECNKQMLRDQVEKEKGKVSDQLNDLGSQRQVEALNMLMQEKDNEIIKAKADRDALEDVCKRYKEELTRWRSKDVDQHKLLGKLNEELNETVYDLKKELLENEKTLEQAAYHFKMQLDNLEQANKALTEGIKSERIDKEELRKRINDDTYNGKSEIAARNKDFDDLRKENFDLEKKLNFAQLEASKLQQEMNNLKSSLVVKETQLSQVQHERELLGEKERRINDDVARLNGKVEILKTDVSKQESENLRLKRELEDSRNSGHGKFTDIVTVHQKERIELEKQCAQYSQQIEHLKSEIERVNSEKAKKESELGKVQQDNIEIVKKLSFTESSLTQASESQRQLSEDKNLMQIELNAVRTRFSTLEVRLDEANKESITLKSVLEKERQASENAQRKVSEVEFTRSQDADNISRLHGRLKDAELENVRLNAALSSSSLKEQEYQDGKQQMSRSQTQLEQLVAHLQEEKMNMEEKWKTDSSKLRILEGEMDGHKKMWEHEVQSRAKISIELARVSKEKTDAVDTLRKHESRMKKYAQNKELYKTKYQQQKRYSKNLEDKIDSYSDTSKDSDYELEHLKDQVRSLKSREDDSKAKAMAHAEVNAKLNDVNVWLEGRAVALEGLNKMRSENEEKRVADANKRAELLQHELNQLKSQDASMLNGAPDALDTQRENRTLKDNLSRFKYENNEMKAMLEYERNKYKSLYASTMHGTVRGNIGNGTANFSGTSPLKFLSSSVPPNYAMSSTPRKEINDPTLAHLRNKLDVTIANHLATKTTSPPSTYTADRRNMSNDYVSFHA